MMASSARQSEVFLLLLWLKVVGWKKREGSKEFGERFVFRKAA